MAASKPTNVKHEAGGIATSTHHSMSRPTDSSLVTETVERFPRTSGRGVIRNTNSLLPIANLSSTCLKPLSETKPWNLTV
jgi:hypothetical protein